MEPLIKKYRVIISERTEIEPGKDHGDHECRNERAGQHTGKPQPDSAVPAEVFGDRRNRRPSDRAGSGKQPVDARNTIIMGRGPLARRADRGKQPEHKKYGSA